MFPNRFTVAAMSKVVLEKELRLIRRRLEAIEEALGEEMTADDRSALDEALREHREGGEHSLRTRLA